MTDEEHDHWTYALHDMTARILCGDPTWMRDQPWMEESSIQVVTLTSEP